MLVNRAYEAFLIGNLHLPQDMFEGSVLDGELVVDEARGTAQFLVFDTLVISGKRMMERSLLERVDSAI